MTCHCLFLCPFLFRQNFTRLSIMVVIIRAGSGVTRCTFALDQYISDGDDNDDNDDDDDDDDDDYNDDDDDGDGVTRCSCAA